jgi:lycopene cyclase domain-containing protein
VAHLTYFAVLAFCLFGTAPLEFVLHVGVYRRWRRLLAAIAPGFVIFFLWDRAAIHLDQWAFNDRYVTGIRLLGLPIEEVCFFVVIPICAVMTIEAVRVRRPAWPIGDELAERT